MLTDLVVIELASVLAGPDVGMFFSELGAKVIKIENKLTQGDITRTWKLSSENNESTVSAYYSSVNWNKEVLFFNLNNHSEREKVYELVKIADIVIANYKNGDATKLKMDYKTLKTINPKIIYGCITGFGSKDKRVAFDVVLQAETGFMSMNGTKQSGSIKLPIAIVDIIAAHQMKQGLLVALLKREKVSKSYMVEVTLYDSALSALKNQACNWLMNQQIPETIGSLHPNIAPYGEIFVTKDNKLVVLAIGSDNQFVNLLKVIGAEELLELSIFSTNMFRVKNRMELANQLNPYFKNYNRNALLKELLKKNVPVGAIKNMKEVFKDKSAQNLVLSETIEGTFTQRIKTSVFKIS